MREKTVAAPRKPAAAAPTALTAPRWPRPMRYANGHRPAPSSDAQVAQRPERAWPSCASRRTTCRSTHSSRAPHPCGGSGGWQAASGAPPSAPSPMPPSPPLSYPSRHRSPAMCSSPHAPQPAARAACSPRPQETHSASSAARHARPPSAPRLSQGAPTGARAKARGWGVRGSGLRSGLRLGLGLGSGLGVVCAEC